MSDNGQNGKTVYVHHSWLFLAFLTVLLIPIIALLYFGVLSVAFEKVGFSPLTVLLILAACLIGSFINIPVGKVTSKVPIVRDETVTRFGMTYRVPRVYYGESVTVVAVNVGGALIPTGVCVYLLAESAFSTILLSFVAVLVVALITHLVARPVKGVGVTSPVFVSPIVAAVMAFILSPAHPIVLAYVGGVLGTLIGADLMNLRKIPQLGAGVASIGGAGTFDGVFLTGIIAVLLAAL